MSPLKNFGVIILGAGASSRMGRPKLLLPWGKTTIIGHLIEQWQALGAAQIAVVCRPTDRDLAAELDRLNFPALDRVENPRPGRGMFSSVLCAANWNGWRKEISRWAIILGDQPHLRVETLRVVLAGSGRNPGAVYQPEFEGHGRHPVILPRRAFAEMKDSRAETLKDFLKQTSCPVLKCSVDDAGLALDLDQPEDYEKAIKLH